MTNFVLLFHILSAAVGLGMIVPATLLVVLYRRTENSDARVTLARLHLRMAMAAQIATILLFITGSLRVEQLHYGWFQFSMTPWLATKQVLILIMLALLFLSSSKIIKLQQALGEKGAEMLAVYEKVRSRAHINYLLALIMAILGVLKPS